MEDLQRKIAAREKPEEEKITEWTQDHDLLYLLLCIAFFADQEIDESEKDIIYKRYEQFVPNVTDESFNQDFGRTTEKFIELKIEENRQKQFDESLIAIKDSDQFDSSKRLALIKAFVDIANADEFIHENEVTLIQNAVSIWELDLDIKKPKSGSPLEI